MLNCDAPSTSTEQKFKIIENEANIANEVWMKHLKQNNSGILPSINDCLFPHHRMAQRTVLEYLCPIGTIILVNTTDYGARFAEVLVRCGKQLKIAFLDDEREKSIWIDYTKVVTNDQALDSAKKTYSFEASNLPKLFNNRQFAKHKNDMTKTLWELVKEGHWIEIQCRMSPQIVYFAKIIKNYNGILLTKIGPYESWIHLSDPYCHHVGWASEQDPYNCETDQLVKYSEFCKSVNWLEVKSNAVPKIVFLRNTVKQHKLEIGSLLSVASSDFRHFTYGHVRNIVNHHFFNVQVADLKMSNTLYPNVPVSIKSPYIFPIGYLESCGIELKIPRSEDMMKDLQKPFGWEIYQQIYTRNGKEVNRCGLVCSEEELKEQKITTMRYVEFLKFEKNKCEFLAAEVIRSERNLIWVRPHFCNNAMVLSIGDKRIYPCGTSIKVGLPIRFEIDPQISVIKNKEFQTSEVTNIFLDKDDIKEIFIPNYIKEEDILPRMYINRRCLSGSFLNRKLLKKWPKFVESGGHTGVLRLIYRMLMQSSRSSLRHTLHSHFQKAFEDENIVPIVNAKYRRNLSEFPAVLKVPVCDSAKKMIAFVKILLTSIGACPNFFSFHNSGKICPFKCNQALKKCILAKEKNRKQFHHKRKVKRGLRKMTAKRKQLIIERKKKRIRLLKIKKLYQKKKIGGGEKLTRSKENECTGLAAKNGSLILKNNHTLENVTTSEQSTSPLTESKQSSPKELQSTPQPSSSGQVFVQPNLVLEEAKPEASLLNNPTPSVFQSSELTESETSNSHLTIETPHQSKNGSIISQVLSDFVSPGPCELMIQGVHYPKKMKIYTDIDDIFGDHKRNLEKRMKFTTGGLKLLAPLPPEMRNSQQLTPTKTQETESTPSTSSFDKFSPQPTTSTTTSTSTLPSTVTSRATSTETRFGIFELQKMVMSTGKEVTDKPKKHSQNLLNEKAETSKLSSEIENRSSQNESKPSVSSFNFQQEISPTKTGQMPFLNQNLPFTFFQQKLIPTNQSGIPSYLAPPLFSAGLMRNCSLQGQVMDPQMMQHYVAQFKNFQNSQHRQRQKRGQSDPNQLPTKRKSKSSELNSNTQNLKSMEKDQQSSGLQNTEKSFANKLENQLNKETVSSETNNHNFVQTYSNVSNCLPSTSCELEKMEPCIESTTTNVTTNPKKVQSRQCSPSNSPSTSSSTCQVKENNKVVLIDKPNVDVVKNWTVDQLSEYLRTNCLNLGSDSIRILKEKKIDGVSLVKLSREQCIELMKSAGNGYTLYRFIDWVRKEE